MKDSLYDLIYGLVIVIAQRHQRKTARADIALQQFRPTAVASFFEVQIFPEGQPARNTMPKIRYLLAFSLFD